MQYSLLKQYKLKNLLIKKKQNYIGPAKARDDGNKISVSRETNHQAIYAALKATAERYGTKITVTGSDEFREKLIMVAAVSRLQITFSDPVLETQTSGKN